MNYLFFAFLTFLVSCSSSQVGQNNSTSAGSVKSDAFKKERVLSKTEVKDYYGSTTKSQNPALQDETLDRLTDDEMGDVKSDNDPLIEISLLCAKGDFDRAFSLASKSFNQFQKIPSYWNLIGNCHLNQGSYRKALLFYNKAIEGSPGYVPSLNNIGVLYSRQGDDQKALIAFERANKQSKFAKTPRYNLARLYLRYGLSESALPLFQGLLNESPQDVDLLSAVGSCYFMMSDYQRAISFYDQIPKKYFELPEIGLNVAVTLKKIGKAEEASKVYGDINTPKTKDLQDYYVAVGQQLGANP